MNGQTRPEFGRWLRHARGRAGMTQQELSAASGVHVNTIKKLESGETQRPLAPVAAKLKAMLADATTHEAADESIGGLVTFTVSGAGVQVVLEGPAKDAELLREQVTAIVREISQTSEPGAEH